MKSIAAILICVLCTALVALLSAAEPAPAPATTQAATEPIAAMPATTSVAITSPATQADTRPGTLPSSFPATGATTTLATTGPTTTFATTSSASRPFASTFPAGTTQPQAAPPIVRQRMGREYTILLQRSVFIKGNQRTYGIDDGFGPAGGMRVPLLGPSSSPYLTTNPSTTPSWSPEANLVFNGASNVNGHMVGFIEDTALVTITRVQVGDSIARGKVSAITLDSLDYNVAGQLTHVMIGQNLAGVDTQVLTTQPVGTATTSPSDSGSGGGSSDIIERMRLRRLKELGG